LRVLSGHESAVSACAWSPDGGRIVSASWDNSLRVWDAIAMKETDFSVRFLPDGNFVSLAEDRNKIIQVSDEAWRWLGWLAPDKNGAITRYPAETFGLLPTFAG
jgi:WD40 repeat protein